MTKQYALACLLAGTILAGPAIAQTAAPQPQGGAATNGTPMNPGPGSVNRPMPLGQVEPVDRNTVGQTQGTTAQTTTTTTGTPMQAQQPMGQAAGMQPMAAPQPGQMLGSDLRGTRVYGANNENIGTISDLLLDREGRLAAVIVGVGGFLGIGQKDVAVPFQALEIIADNRTGMGGAAGTTGTAGMAGRDPNATGTVAGTGTAGTTGMGGTTGMAGTGGAAGTTAAAGAQQATTNPNRIVLRGMTKADLENAPEFRSDGRAATNQTGTMGGTATGTTGGTGTGTTTAPRQ